MYEKSRLGNYLVITGLAGSGKTQLARYYLEHKCTELKRIAELQKTKAKFIVREFVLEEKDGLKDGYIKFIQDIQRCNPSIEFHISSLEQLHEKELFSIISTILNTKYSDHEIIFFYDNVDSDFAVNVIRETVINPFFKNNRHAVITSQRKRFFTLNKDHEVNIRQGLTVFQALMALKREDLVAELQSYGIQKDAGKAQYSEVISAVNLLSSEKDNSDLIAAIDLVNMFDYLPLAIIAAQLYMAKTGRTLKAYKELLEKQNESTAKFLANLENIHDSNMKDHYRKKTGACSQISAIGLVIMNMDIVVQERRMVGNFSGILPCEIMKIISGFSNNCIPDFFIKKILTCKKKENGEEESFVDSFLTVLDDFSLLLSIRTIPNPQSEDLRAFSFHSQTFLAAQSLIEDEERSDIFSCALEIFKLTGEKEFDNNKKNIEVNSIIGENFITLLTNSKMILSGSIDLIVRYLDTIFNPRLLVKFLQKIKNIEQELKDDELFFNILMHIYENIINAYAEIYDEKNKQAYIDEFKTWVATRKQAPGPNPSMARIALHAADMNLFGRSFSLKGASNLQDLEKLKVVTLREDRYLVQGNVRQAIIEEKRKGSLPADNSFEYYIYLFRRACLFMHNNQLSDASKLFDEMTLVQGRDRLFPLDFFHDVLIAKAILLILSNKFDEASNALTEINGESKQKLYLECLLLARYCAASTENSQINIEEVQLKLSLLKKELIVTPGQIHLIDLFLARKQGRYRECLSLIQALNQDEKLPLRVLFNFSSNITKRWLYFCPKNFSLLSSEVVQKLLKIDLWEFQIACLESLQEYLELSRCYLDKIKNLVDISEAEELFDLAFSAYMLSQNKLTYSEIQSLFIPFCLGPFENISLLAQSWMHLYGRDVESHWEEILSKLISLEKNKYYYNFLSLKILIYLRQKKYSEVYKSMQELHNLQPPNPSPSFILSKDKQEKIWIECCKYFKDANPEIAIACYQLLHLSHKKGISYYYGLGGLYLKKKDYKYAVENFFEGLRAQDRSENAELFKKVEGSIENILANEATIILNKGISIQEKIGLYRICTTLLPSLLRVNSFLVKLLLNRENLSAPSIQEIQGLRVLLVTGNGYNDSELVLSIADFFFAQKEYSLAIEDYRRYLNLKSFLFTCFQETSCPEGEKFNENSAYIYQKSNGFSMAFKRKKVTRNDLKLSQNATNIFREMVQENYFLEGHTHPISDFRIIDQLSKMECCPGDFFKNRYSSQALVNLSDAMLNLAESISVTELKRITQFLLYIETHDKRFIAENKVFLSIVYGKMAERLEKRGGRDDRDREEVKKAYKKAVELDPANIEISQKEKAFLKSIKDYPTLISQLETKYSSFHVGWSAACKATQTDLHTMYVEYSALGNIEHQYCYLQKAESLCPQELSSLFPLIKVLIKKNQIEQAFNKFLTISLPTISSSALYEYHILEIIIHTKKRNYSMVASLYNTATTRYNDKTRFIRYLFAMMKMVESKDREVIKDKNKQEGCLTSVIEHLSFINLQEKQEVNAIFTEIMGYFKEYESFEFFEEFPYFYYLYALYLKSLLGSLDCMVELYKGKDISKRDDLSEIIVHLQQLRSLIFNYSSRSSGIPMFIGVPRPETKFERLKHKLSEHLSEIFSALENKKCTTLVPGIYVNYFIKKIEELRINYSSKKPNPLTTKFFSYYEALTQANCSFYFFDFFDEDRGVKCALLLNWYFAVLNEGTWHGLLKNTVDNCSVLTHLYQFNFCKKNLVESAIEQAISRYKKNLTYYKSMKKITNYSDKSEIFINGFYDDMFSIPEEDKTDHYKKKVMDFSESMSSGFPSDLNNFLLEEFQKTGITFERGGDNLAVGSFSFLNLHS